MIIRNKFNGYINGNNRLYPAGGGGGSQQTTSTAYNTNIPEYARPYVEQMLGATQRQLFTGSSDAQGNFTPTGFNNFTPYGSTYAKDAQGNQLKDANGNTIFTNTAQQQAQAAVSPMSYGQQAAISDINNYVAPQQTNAASQMMADLAGRSAASGYYSPMQAERFQLGSPQQIAASRVNASSFTQPGVSQGYMSPYMQNVVNAQQREARRAGEMQRNQNQAQAVNAGAFGGSREALIEAERQRNLGTQLGDIQAQGLQNAYQQGMGQFNAEQNAYLQAQQANQQAGLTAQQANQQANMQTGIQNLQAQQAAQAAQEQSRQFGAGLGLQGYGQAGQFANQLGALGQQQYGQDMGTIQAMNQLGGGQQQQNQAVINQQLQNYSTAQQYPLMQLGVMSNMLRGLPMQASTTQNYQAAPSLLSQGAGALGTGLGLYQQYQKAFPGQKEGGVVKMAGGGITTGANPYKLAGMYEKFSDEQLAKEKDDPVAQREMQHRAALRASMARGGIVAFRKGKTVKEDTSQKAEDITLPEADVGGAGILKALEGSPTSAVPAGPEPEKQPARDYTGSIRRSYAGAQPKEEAIAMPMDNEGIVAAARKNVSPVPTAARTTPTNASATDPAGIMTGKVNQLYSDVEAANLEAGRDMQGNLIEKKKANPLAELEATTNEEILRQKALRDESKSDKIKRYQKEREEMNLADPANREREMFEARKKRGEESEKETARNNLVRFLTKWGTIPGSAMRGIIGAGSDLVDKMDLDSKQREKFLNELDDIESRINNAEYNRRLGDEGRAREEQQKAGELYFKLGHDLRTAKVNYAIKEMDAESKYEIAQLKAEAAGHKAANKAPVIQMADKEFENLIAQGKPANAVTYGQALRNVSAMLPGVQAAGIAAGPAATNAATNVTKATTDAADLKRKEEADAIARLDKANTAAKTEISGRDFRKKLTNLYEAEKADTPAKKTAIKEREIAKVKEAKKLEYNVTPPAAAAAPAAAPAARPVPKYNPTTGKWE